MCLGVPGSVSPGASRDTKISVHEPTERIRIHQFFALKLAVYAEKSALGRLNKMAAYASNEDVERR
jgi:hypothetical protein